MNYTKLNLIVVIVLLSTNCNPKLPDSFHMGKKYWDISDYNAAISQIKYRTPKEEGLPRLSDPLTAPVFNKLVDKENVSVILEDEYLGLKHRDEIAQEFFDASIDIFKLYQIIDIQDKFVYPIEIVRIIGFGLHTQFLYFKIGNDKIIKSAVDPNDRATQNIIKRNEQSLVDNYCLKVAYLREEYALSDGAKIEYAKVMSYYFQKLIKEYPDANYFEIKKTAELLTNKVESQEIKSFLQEVIQKIEETN